MKGYWGRVVAVIVDRRKGEKKTRFFSGARVKEHGVLKRCERREVPESAFAA